LEETEVSLESIAKFQLTQASELLTRISFLLETEKGKNISGLTKLLKRVVAEKVFLEDLLSGTINLQKPHVECSNLGYLTAILDITEIENDVIAIQKVFHINVDNKKERYEVDVVCRNGGMWIKVKAMKPETIQSLYFGNGSFGTKGLDTMAEQMIDCASQHPVNYSTPICVFWFVNGVTSDVVEELEAIGILCHGKIIKETDFNKKKKKELSQLVQSPTNVITSIPGELNLNLIENCQVVNLDITTLISYVSHIANELDSNITVYSDTLLQQQDEEERKCPVLPIINKMIEGKKLVVTECAWNKFWEILMTVGGEKEKERGTKLLHIVEIIENNPSEKSLTLIKGPKIKQQHIDIFGTGDQIKAITLTANGSFVRVANDQGVEFNVFVHPARALTEQKQTKERNL